MVTSPSIYRIVSSKIYSPPGPNKTCGGGGGGGGENWGLVSMDKHVLVKMASSVRWPAYTYQW